jgi:hypothetical protein
VTVRSAIRLFFICLLVALTSAASAQTHIQFYSSKVGALPTECQQESAILALLLAQYHSPSWTWFVACDEAAWSKIADHIGFTVETITTAGQLLAATDLQAKTTYVRGWALLCIRSATTCSLSPGTSLLTSWDTSR